MMGEKSTFQKRLTGKNAVLGGGAGRWVEGRGITRGFLQQQWMIATGREKIATMSKLSCAGECYRLE